MSDVQVRRNGDVLEAYGRAIDLSRTYYYTTIFDLELLPGTREGQLVVTASVVEGTTTPPFGYTSSAIDLRFLGHVGAASSVLKLDFCTQKVGVSICPLPAESRWQRVTVQARLGIDGRYGDPAFNLATALLLVGNVANATVIGRFHMSERGERD